MYTSHSAVQSVSPNSPLSPHPSFPNLHSIWHAYLKQRCSPAYSQPIGVTSYAAGPACNYENIFDSDEGGIYDEFEDKSSTRLTPLPEQRLWQARLMQFLQDSLANHPRRYAMQIREEACAWFDKSNEDFAATCDFAGISPDTALAMFTRVQISGTVPRLTKG